jgi:hypothetical protein
MSTGIEEHTSWNIWAEVNTKYITLCIPVPECVWKFLKKYPIPKTSQRLGFLFEYNIHSLTQNCHQLHPKIMLQDLLWKLHTIHTHYPLPPPNLCDLATSRKQNRTKQNSPPMNWSPKDLFLTSSSHYICCSTRTEEFVGPSKVIHWTLIAIPTQPHLNNPNCKTQTQCDSDLNCNSNPNPMWLWSIQILIAIPTQIQCDCDPFKS